MTRISVGKLGPSTAMMPMASKMNGKASWASASVMTTVSSQPRRKPATTPSAEPTSPPTPPPAASRAVRCRSRGRATAAATTRSAGADAGIEDAIEHVDGEVDDDEERGRDEDDALHDRVVAVVDRLDGEPAHPRPREHGLGHDGAAEQGSELEPGDGHDRHGRVLQRVLGDDQRLGQALGTRGADVVRAQDLEHGRASEPGDVRPRRTAEREG